MNQLRRADDKASGARYSVAAAREAFAGWLGAAALPEDREIVALSEGRPVGGLEIRGSAAENAWVAFDRSRPPNGVVIVVQRPALVRNTLIWLGEVQGNLQIRLSGGHTRLRIGDSPLFNGTISMGDHGSVLVGDQTTASKVKMSAQFGEIEIGQNCMISGMVNIEAATYHGLILLEDGVARLDERRSRISIGNHVWLGARSSVMGRATISDGAIVGADAVVAGQVAANSAVVGNPARLLRENVTWSRHPNAVDPGTMNYLKDTGFVVASADAGSAAAINTRNGASA